MTLNVKRQTVFTNRHFNEHVYRCRNRYSYGTTKLIKPFFGIIVHSHTNHSHSAFLCKRNNILKPM